MFQRYHMACHGDSVCLFYHINKLLRTPCGTPSHSLEEAWCHTTCRLSQCVSIKLSYDIILCYSATVPRTTNPSTNTQLTHDTLCDIWLLYSKLARCHTACQSVRYDHNTVIRALSHIQQKAVVRWHPVGHHNTPSGYYGVTQHVTQVCRF